MTQIFIEGYELDINEDLSNQITYAIDDITKLDSKRTSFSKTITLPGTANNNKLFGNIFEVANSNFNTSNTQQNISYSFNASRSAQARIDIDNITIMKGVMRLLEVVVDETLIEYQIAVFGELGGLFSKLGSKKIEDLDFSAYNHTLNVSNIANSWDNAGAGEGYCYTLIDYGNTSPATNPLFAKKSFYFTAFRPAMFVREYIDKIITGAGYTWESNFFNTNFFKSLIIPNNQIRFAFKKTQIFSGSPSGMVDLLANETQDTVLIGNTIPGFFTTADNKTFTYGGADTFTNGTVTVSITGTWRILEPILGSRLVKFVILKNGVIALQEVNFFGGGVTQIGGFGNFTPQNFSFTYTFNSWLSTGLTLATNDTFALGVYSVSGTSIIEINISQATLTINGAPTLTPALYGDSVDLSSTIPKGILQKDFFASIVKMFYLMITEDKFKEKHLKIEPFIDFYNVNPSTYIDWSDKVDRSKPYIIKPMSEINSRYYTLKYKDDSDYWNDRYKKKWVETYGQRTFDNALDFAKDSDSVDVIFSPTPLVGYQGAGYDKVFPAIYKLNNGVEEQINHNIRILSAKKLTGKTAWKIYDINNTELGTYTSYGYAGHYDDPDNVTTDLNFGAAKELYFTLSNSIWGTAGLSTNLFNVFYSTYFAEITDKDSRMVTYHMKLTPKDIYNLDFGKFILIDGVLYRLDKIIDYSDGEVVKVQLLRVIYNNYY